MEGAKQGMEECALKILAHTWSNIVSNSQPKQARNLSYTQGRLCKYDM